MNLKPIIKGIMYASIAFTSTITFANAEDGTTNETNKKTVLSNALESELKAIIKEANFPGITASIIMPDGTTLNVVAGFADKESKVAMDTDTVMPAGSVGKTFMAATVLQISAEQNLDIDTPITKYFGDRDWYKSVPNGDDITLRMLLNHTSGLDGSHIDYPATFALFQKTFGPDGKSMAELGFKNSDNGMSFAENEPKFAAGGRFSYTDSNYILSGLIIEDICKCLILDEAKKRFTAPLGLMSTGPTPRTHNKYAAGYEGEADILPGAGKKVTLEGRLYFDPALEWMGGGFASTSNDLAIWAKALLSAKIISPEMLNEMVTPTNDFLPAAVGWKYGLGVMIANDSNGLRLMHGGYIPGYSTYIEYQPKSNMSLAFQVNTRSGFGANRKIADRLWAVIANHNK